LSITQRHTNFRNLLNVISPAFTESFFNMFIQSLTNKSFKLDPKWRIHPPPSFATHQPTISDNLIQYLTDGSIKSTPAIRRFVSSNELEFEDGSVAEVDAVICCTGYSRGFDLIPELQPEPNIPLEWAENPNSDGRSLPRLYQNIFPPTRGDSIAYLNNFTLPRGFFHIADLAAMAVTQIWKNNPPLPSEEVMKEAIDAHHKWMISLVKKETVITDLIREEIWMKWIRETAGTGVDEKLGYGLEGWNFWFGDWRFCNLLMGGIESPLVDRIFDGKRKNWDDARQAIVNQNEEAEERARSNNVLKKD
jgi:dimethylaniline monooxygenase (N-oxide forming)